MLGEVQDNHKFYDPVDEYMEQPCLNTGITEFSKGCFEPVAGYVEKLDTVNYWLWLCDGKKVPYHDPMPGGHSVPFFIKHEEQLLIWNHSLDWLHWKSKVT